MSEDNKPQKIRNQQKRPTLRQEVIDLDQQILGLLLKRYNLLQRMRGKRGFVLPVEEKQLRDAWQSEAIRYSSDPKLSSQLFSLLQDIQFYPKPNQDAKQSVGRTGFNLAPAQKPVDFSLILPKSHWHVATWLTLATFQGEELDIAHCLMHDAQNAYIRILNSLGAHISTKNDEIHVNKSPALTIDNLSLHVGNDLNNFYLLAAQCLVRPSQVRFTAEGRCKMTSLTAIAHFLPTLGARLSYVLPKSSSFPVRIESTGDLPPQITAPQNLPAGFIQSLLMALPFAEHSVELNFADHPLRDTILENSLDIFKQMDVQAAEISPYIFAVEPQKLQLPHPPHIPCDPNLALFLLTIPLFLGGKATFFGRGLFNEKTQDPLALLQDLGLEIKEEGESYTVK
ncbi:MAG: hypothetical protein IK079_03270, partial [Desulfovibrio sp.]|nr:hypothetical protein [Desulfovibrio sp.]